MRNLLDRFYGLSLGLAAIFLFAICVIVLAQVGCNIFNSILKMATGTAGDYTIPSYAEFAGFFLAASSFLALAGTFRGGAHIRVSLILMQLSDPVRRVFEAIAVLLGLVMASYLCYYLAALMYESYEYGDMSPGIVPVELWIPQSALVLGTAVFSISLFDSFIQILRGAVRAHPDGGELE
ncbi:TRAP transporter small permease [Curvivirga sp.]|uniref:TRAP transporter small permease n=1 Tax=Curvivirga sp. TaxID=2856848 RepID=UPI003B58F0A6